MLQTSEQVKENKLFLQALIELCCKHGKVISHEDTHGSFIVRNLNEDDLNWLEEADCGE